MTHLLFLGLRCSLIVSHVHELLKCPKLHVKFPPEHTLHLFCLLPQGLLEVKLPEGHIQLRAQVLKQCRPILADVVEEHVAGLALVRLDDSVEDLFLNEFRRSVVASLVVKYGSSIDLKDVH